jgi:hypothetical protein
MVIRTFTETSSELRDAEINDFWQENFRGKSPQEINQIIGRTHSASSNSRSQEFNNLKAYAMLNKVGGNEQKYNDVQNIINNNNSVVHSASEQKQQGNSNSNLKSFAVANRLGGNLREYEELQNMIEESKNQVEVLEQMESSKSKRRQQQQGQTHQASELKHSDKDQFLRFYKLVQMIASRDVNI